MTAELLLRYERVDLEGGASAYSGEILERVEDGSEPVVRLEVFSCTTFKKILICLSKLLSAKDYSRVVMERIDRQGLAPVVLDVPTTELLRMDPAKAIRMMSYEGDPTFSGKSRQSPPPIILAGYDTISETLGDVVYCRVKPHKFMGGLTSPAIECPGCGRWIQALRELRCTESCPIVVRVTYVEGWGRVPTGVLLNLALPRYFLPRGFNKSKPWISRETLQELYDQWLLIREQNKEKKT